MLLVDALDEKQNINQQLRTETIRSVLLDYVEPFLEKYSTRQAILEVAKKPRGERRNPPFLVWWPLLEYVGVKRRGPFDADFDPEWGP